MSARPPLRREPRRRGRRVLRLWIGAALVLAVFAAGLALGQSLDDNPGTGETQTLVRTLRPLPLPPERETVTVTVNP
ncbi:MAG TPA: hypothetical protein VJT84_05835 [Gaiellaceae bacterium]|nr:hypothetical protein [Gaiellaceae bacterium]